MAIEEIGRVDQSLGVTLEASVGLGINPIQSYGSKEQKDAWLPDLVAGQRLAGFGLTEPGAGSDAGAVTLMVKKVPSGTARASGTDLLSAGLSLKATADTNVTGSLTATAGDKKLAAGDGLALVPTGTLTAVDAVTVTVELKRI